MLLREINDLPYKYALGLITQILFDQISFTDLSKACKHAAGPYKRF